MPGTRRVRHRSALTVGPVVRVEPVVLAVGAGHRLAQRTVTGESELLPILSNGEAVALVHSHAGRYHSRPDIAYMPVHDAPPARWALLWRTAAETDLIRSFARTAREVGPGIVEDERSPDSRRRPKGS